MIKVYTLKRMRAAVLFVTDGANTIRANFQPSYGTQGKTNGKIVVTDENLQKIFEADPKFNTAYYLSDEYEDTKAPHMETSKSGDKFIPPMPSASKKLRTQAEIDAENAAKEEAMEKPAKKSKKAKGVVLESKNDVLDYLADKGESVGSEDELVELMQKYNITING